MELQGRRGAGAFQWNRGGWFGAQIGSTLWLVILGTLSLLQGRAGGGLLLAWGVLPNLFGLALWRRRNTLRPYPAVQALIAACGLAALGAMLSLWATGLPQSVSGLPDAWFLLMYPGLMLAFHLQERSARKASA